MLKALLAAALFVVAPSAFAVPALAAPAEAPIPPLQPLTAQQLQTALAQANAVIAALREQRQQCVGQTMDQQAAALAQQMLAQAAKAPPPAEPAKK